MPDIRKVGLIAVGVDKTTVLPVLKGAASGAGKLAQWLLDQQPFGVTPVIKLLTDADGKVCARDVQDAARGMVALGDLDVLILYFSGHGLVKAGFDEQVLLSDVGAYKDEAIAITPTALNARYSGVPHVIIISDSCRNAVDPFGQLGTVVGKPALERGPVVGISRSKVDVFYATEPSQTAKEADGDGFFTDVLLDALTHPTSEVCESWVGTAPGVVVIPAWKLETWLDTQVPLRAAQHVPAFDQSPDFTVTSRQPLFFGYAKAPPPNAPAAAPEPYVPGGGGILPEAGPPPAPAPGFDTQSVPPRRRTVAISEVAAVLRSSPWAASELNDRMTEDAGFSKAIKDYVGSDQGREAFETRTGYSVIGDQIERACLSGGAAGELAKTDEGVIGRDLRLYPAPFGMPGQEGTVAVFLKSGSLCFLPIMPGYIGTLHVHEGRAVSLSFEISAQFQPPWMTEQQRIRLAQRRALAASLAASGKLGSLAKAEGDVHGAFLREDKFADPTLGIYASYAYALSGNDADARSVYEWFSQHPSLDIAGGLPVAPTPFDVAMLAGESIQGNLQNLPAIAPFCPMMSLGWSVLASYLDPHSLHVAIVEAAPYRLNCEWTTFRQKDIGPLITAFESGEIK